jgi:hypothetical protein
MNKRKDLSNEDKNEILDLLNKNTPREVLCEQFNVCNATISNIKKHEEVIRADCLKRTQKRCRLSKYDEMENYLLQWFLEKRKQNQPINGPVLCA